MHEVIQSLEAQLHNVVADPHADLTHMIDVQNDLAWELRHIDPQRTLTLSQAAYDAAQSRSYPRGLLYSLRNLTAIYTYISPEHDRALARANQALALLKIWQDKLVHAHVLECLAIIHMDVGDYPAAHQYQGEALKLCREAGDRRTESMLLNDMGILEYQTGDLPHALELFEMALQIAQSDGDQDMQARMLCNVGDLLTTLGRLDEALPYLEQSLALSEQLGTRKVQASALDGLSKIYSAREDFEQALLCLQRADELTREFKDQRSQAEFLRNIARVHQRRQAVEVALDYARQALTRTEAVNNKTEVAACHQLLAELFEAQGAFEQALFHFRQFHITKEEALNEQSYQKLKTLRVIHETETARQEAEIYRLKNIELQTALDKVKQLSGLLPICSSCKKIRDDDGYWYDVAVFIRDHSEADFTHSICPSCYERLYPESYKKRIGPLVPAQDSSAPAD